ncbi:hypothetical protein ACFU98_26625 [Streptomyces sp. NPDC057575]|uniref:hypothetical protein n=1 Tax=unclassified Streptomyces TaxID=2593676 RepID=UPI0036A620F2
MALAAHSDNSEGGMQALIGTRRDPGSAMLGATHGLAPARTTSTVEALVAT